MEWYLGLHIKLRADEEKNIVDKLLKERWKARKRPPKKNNCWKIHKLPM